jgi:hypothetical protein
MPHARADIKALADHVATGGPGAGVVEILDVLYR